MAKWTTRTLLMLLAWGALFAPAQAQERITHMELVADKQALVAGEQQWLGVRLKMAEHWHVYWTNPGDSGLPPTVAWSLPEGTTLGDMQWPFPQSLPFDFLTNYGYEREVILPVPVTYTGDADSVTITGEVDVLVCKDICIPESDTVSITLPVADSAADSTDATAIEAALARVPDIREAQGVLSLEGDTLIFHLANATVEDGLEEVEFFPLTESLIENSAERDWAHGEKGDVVVHVPSATKTLPDTAEAVLRIALDNGDEAIWQVTYVAGEPAARAEPEQAAEVPLSADLTFVTALLFAFLGGIILNAMPCVFPILSLKALKVAKYSGKEHALVRKHGISYTLGILVAFAAIVIPLIALSSAGESIGWGFQLQSPGFVAALALILFAVGLSLSGLFHLPSFLGGVHVQDSDTTRGSFFTGVLAVLVATPCTGPFMAPALGYALSQPALEAFLIFEALGLGLAFPYLLISFVPASRALLPKPGAWMERMKEVLAFPMYATAAWLLWVLVQQTGANGMFWALGGAIALTMALWASKLTSSGWKLLFWLFAMAMLVLAIIKQDAAPPMKAEAFSIEHIETLRAQDKPVFVYATAAWCVTCKINENVALNTQTVQDFFTHEAIEVVEADWTNRGEEIAQYLRSFGRSGVPMYVFYPVDKEPVLLPQLLTPSLVVDEISAVQ